MSENKNFMCVFLNVVEGRDDELNGWLGNGHIQEIVEGHSMVREPSPVASPSTT
jgi:hypothetical protein